MKDERVIKRIEVDKEVYEVGVDGVLWIEPYLFTNSDDEKELCYRVTHKESGTIYKAESVSNIEYEVQDTSVKKAVRKDLLKLFSYSLLISLIVGLFKGLITLKTIGILLLGGVAILVAILVLVIGVSFLIR